ncbi:hypothetical protein Tco_1031461, partial [Tanacetum coccineum]
QTTEQRAKCSEHLGKSKKEMDIVKDRISYSGGKLDKGKLHMQGLISLMKDMVSFLDAANIFEIIKAEGDKVSLEEDMELELAEEAKAKAAKEAKAAEETTKIP